MRCSFCNKIQDSVATLVSAPGEYASAYICDQCVRICSAAMGETPRPSGQRSVNMPGCSFCHASPDVVRLLPSPGDPPKALICEQCLAVCMSIFEDDDLPLSD